jgi:hypothetical protein
MLTPLLSAQIRVVATELLVNAFAIPTTKELLASVPFAPISAAMLVFASHKNSLLPKLAVITPLLGIPRSK